MFLMLASLLQLNKVTVSLGKTQREFYSNEAVTLEDICLVYPTAEAPCNRRTVDF